MIPKTNNNNRHFVIFEGYTENIKKVSATSLLRDKYHFDFHQAKRTIDSLIDDCQQIIETQSIEESKSLIEDVTKFGIKCKFLEDVLDEVYDNRRKAPSFTLGMKAAATCLFAHKNNLKIKCKDNNK